MLDFFRSRRGVATSAAVVIVCIIVFLLATAPNLRSLLGGGIGPTALSTPTPAPVAPEPNAMTAQTGGASTGESAAAPSAAAPPLQTPGDKPAAQQARNSGATPGTAAGTPSSGESKADEAGPKPTFDIVRIEPTGESVIAARGAPNADIVLLDGGTPIARAKADASGQVALIPPPLKPGEHSLVLSMSSPDGQVVSSQSVAVSVPDQPRTAPMVALTQPGQPTTILSGPVAGSATPAPAPGASAAKTTPTPTPSEPVAIRSVEVESLGSFYATGKATPGSISRIYLNGAFVATVTADASGTWSLKINKGMKSGRYMVRADQVDPAGKVTARAEVPFDYPVQVGSTAPRTDPARKSAAAAPPVGAAPAAPSGEMQGRPTKASPSQTPGAAPSQKVASASGANDGIAGAPVGSNPPAASPLNAAAAKASKVSPAPQPAPPEPPSASTKQSPAPGTAILASKDAVTKPGSGGTAGPAVGNAAPKAPSALVPGRSASGETPAAEDGEGATVVSELVTAKVTRGDSLWRISRQMLGHGVRYTQIYAANTQQIRDPRLIYPGQIFVMPQE